MSQIKWFMEKHEWFTPGMLTLKFGGFNRTIELHFDAKQLRKIKSPEETYAFIKQIRESQKLDKYLVFQKCPECGWELPTMDFDVGGWCSFCGERKARDGAKVEWKQ